MNSENRNWYLYIAGVCIITILLLLNNATSHDLSFALETDVQSGVYTEYKPYLSLPKGTYEFRLDGAADCAVTNAEGTVFGTGNGTFEVTLDKDESQLIIEADSGSISNVTIHSSHAIFQDITVVSLLFAAFLLYIGYIKFKRQASLTGPAITVTLILIATFATYPVFTNYLSYGQDMNFHLFRIEGLKDGLLAGQFPVRIDPTHNNGYGYITASVYPSLFLYFPALLRICGISMVTSYKLFLFAVNAATAFIMYGCTKAMTKSKFAGLFASLVYTLSTWRMVNLIYRSAIGEALAMTFFPIVILGLYYLIKGDKAKWWVFTIGCSAIFHSHIISCIFVVMLSAVTFLVFIRDLLRDKRWLALLQSAAVTVLVNLWYLIPFVTYYLGVDLTIRHTAENTEYFGNAIFPTEMFNFFNDKFGASQLIPVGIRENMSLSLGVGVTICFVIAALYFIFGKKESIKDYPFFAEQFLFAVFILFMASTLFPSELLQKPKLLNALAGTIRMPWRFLSLASPILCIVAAAIILTRIKGRTQKQIVLGATSVICACAAVIFGTAYTCSHDVSMRIGQAAYTDGAAGWDNEYFIHGTLMEKLVPEQYTTSSEHISIDSYEKDGTNIELNLSGAANGEYVEVPLLYYPGYAAKDDHGNSLEIVKGTNNVLRVMLQDKTKNINIRYAGLTRFKIGCVLSLLTIAGLAALWFYRRKKEQL